jgi:uncharacterized membrane protein (TIGR02234 family)
MTSGLEAEPDRPRPLQGLRGSLGSRGSRQELTVTLLLGAVGAGLIFLATRQGWAHVRTIPPKPLPASLVTVTGAALVPYADALVLAGLATLAAILATRRLVRRLAGGLLAVIGAALAASAFTLSAASAISAASSNATPETAPAGSVMAGSGTVQAGAPNVAGAVSHVTFGAGSWQALVVVGAIAMIGAGVLVAWRADRMAVMSSRYDAPTAAGRARSSTLDDVAEPAASAAPARPGRSAGAAEPGRVDAASAWEALTRGEDPTTVTNHTARA